MKIMKVLSNFFGNNKKLSASEIAIIDSNSKAKTLDVRIKDYSLKPKVLYESATGSNSTITLNDSVENYEYIEIFYKSNGTSHNNVKLYQANGKNAELVIPTIYSSGGAVYLEFLHKKIKLNKASVEVVSYGYFQTYNKTINSVNITGNYIYITKVIGYSNE